MKDHDDLPVSLCMLCADQLIVLSTFRDTFRENDRRLRERWDVQYLIKSEEVDTGDHHEAAQSDEEEVCEVAGNLEYPIPL